MCEKSIVDKIGRRIKLKGDPFDIVEAYHQGELIGAFHFSYVCEPHPLPSSLKLINMHLEEKPGYTHCGIGTAIVDWVEEYTGEVISFGSNDGAKADDGSHLTGDGPAFFKHILERRAKL